MGRVKKKEEEKRKQILNEKEEYKLFFLFLFNENPYLC